MEKTLGIIKPDAVANNQIGQILSMAEESGLRIDALKMIRLDQSQAEGFYRVHRDRPFFGDLTRFMSEGPVVVMVLSGDDAIARWRNAMGATDPARAEEGTIRKRFAANIERNAVHGSDSAESADFEIGYFFGDIEQGR
jgi:nucleoside-diphosphate kinase